MSATADQREDLRRVYMTVYQDFAISTSDVAAYHKAINTRYARELLGTLQHANLIVLTEDGEGSDAWQTLPTYDNMSQEEAEAKIDEWLSANLGPTPTNATSPGASPRSSLKSAESGPHPCRCGCGEVIATRSVYRPGHDARHAGQVGRAIAAQYATPGFDRRELLADLGSDKLRAKAERIAEKATSKAKPASKPDYVEGTIKVGKTEYPAMKYDDGHIDYFKGDATIPASKTAAKTFQEG